MDSSLVKLAGDQASIHVKQLRNSVYIYPPVILMVVFSVIIFLLAFVVPKFVTIFETHGANLPLLTAYVVGASNFLLHRSIYVILPIFWLFAGACGLLYSPQGLYRFHKLLLQIPIIKRFEYSAALSTLLLEYRSLLSLGVSPQRAYDEAVAKVDNTYLRQELKAMSKSMAGGEGLSLPMGKLGMLPKPVVATLAASEETDEQLAIYQSVAEVYAARNETEGRTMISVTEASSILLLGLSVGTMVIAMYLPIFKVCQCVSSH